MCWRDSGEEHECGRAEMKKWWRGQQTQALLHRNTWPPWGKRRSSRDGIREAEVGTKQKKIRGGQTHSFIADTTACWGPQGREGCLGIKANRKGSSKLWQMCTYCSGLQMKCWGKTQRGIKNITKYSWKTQQYQTPPIGGALAIKKLQTFKVFNDVKWCQHKKYKTQRRILL